ncbi:stage II sporulation protein M [Lottiidibacillus patelloidae]|uniref:Stage II sporulation protein M n=1 Tax=Lottiidibacillus patelloidae TaxID=2670334 RepID=A0A263BTW5_9BACI|nr:stage II sporulation protein M [Lottiidibacillus patelloidae]OZM57125.1 stage II sporulation protein M [Lottiidibacillus patelloidae]
MNRNRNFSFQLAKHFQNHAAIYVFTTMLFIIGVIFGAIIVNSLNAQQKHDLFHYLTMFFGQAAEGEFASSNEMFLYSIFHYMKFIGLIWILGLAVIGLPITLVLLFLKGIVVGFTVGFLVNQFGLEGFFLSFVSVMPQNLILIPAFIIVSTGSISFSLRMIKQLMGERTKETLPTQLVKYTVFVIVAGLFIVAAASFEGYISPSLIKFVVNY